jgi:hypothetical protein
MGYGRRTLIGTKAIGWLDFLSPIASRNPNDICNDLDIRDGYIDPVGRPAHTLP